MTHSGERSVHLVLVGMMGAGKTTVGKACAARLDRPFVDTDEIVEAAAGVPVADIFAAEGEAGFRERERGAVSDAMLSPAPLVIACGGGAVLDGANRSLLRARGFVVWLYAPPDVLATRVGRGAARPLLTGDGASRLTTLTRMARLREDTYRSAAHATVDASRDVAAVADDIVGQFELARQ